MNYRLFFIGLVMLGVAAAIEVFNSGPLSRGWSWAVIVLTLLGGICIIVNLAILSHRADKRRN